MTRVRRKRNPKWSFPSTDAPDYEVETYRSGGKWGWKILDDGGMVVREAPADEYDFSTENQAIKVAMWHVNDLQKSWIPWDLTQGELDTLSELRGRYLSARKLYDSYIHEPGGIQYDDAHDALQATEEDGGDFGTVPLAGGTLEQKIWKLWAEVEKRD